MDAVQAGGTVLVTADHGNAETMCERELMNLIRLTCDQVPFILIDERYRGRVLRQGGSLRDIAPTMLSLLGRPLPAEMTGKNLILGN